MTYDPDKHHRRSIRLKGYDYAQPGAYFVTIVAQGRECLFGDAVNGEMRLNDAGRMVERWWAELGKKYPDVIPDAGVVMPNHFHGIVIITDGAGAHIEGAHIEGAHIEGAHIGAPLRPTAAADDVGADLRVCPGTDAGARGDVGAHIGAPLRPTTVADDVNAGAHIGAPLRPTTVADDVNAGARTGAPIPEIVQWFKTMTTNEYIRGVKNLGWTPFPGKLWQRNYYEHIIRNDASLNRIRQYIADNPAHWADDTENPEKAAR